jgi:hypothetical protein
MMLAKGGYGDIYKHKMGGKDVVVKVSSRNQEEEVEKFVREIVLTRSFSSFFLFLCNYSNISKALYNTRMLYHVWASLAHPPSPSS